MSDSFREFQKMAVLEMDFHEVEVQYSATFNFYPKSYETLRKCFLQNVEMWLLQLHLKLKIMCNRQVRPQPIIKRFFEFVDSQS